MLLIKDGTGHCRRCSAGPEAASQLWLCSLAWSSGHTPARSDETWIYPGHGDDTTLGAERPSLPEWRSRGW